MNNQKIVSLGITGSAGRMGRRIAAIAIESQGRFDIASALESPRSPDIGRDIGEVAGVGKYGVSITAEIQDKPQVLIDFSSPDSTLNWLDVCRSRNIPMVIGTTGLTESQLAAVADTAGALPIVHAANMSVGVNLLLRVVAQVARVLGGDYDIEISETHHRFKKDAPSGTAIALAKSICSATGKSYGEVAQLGRGGVCPRKPGEIGMHALRVGDTVGEHTVHFGNLGETITIGHSAHTRDTFVHGALRAAAWLVGKKPGLYSMLDVLDL
ncbi:MAG: 4-hydroxy-tetrahydrodipicolinate reductase [Planctomycetes bacterium]|jgi:4-hydroxy-tetrahydrodipicolinate reductase|nr:4-hydroxy-tetrahydrodipicolinate reductase [Planctomycetota bacterium]